MEQPVIKVSVVVPVYNAGDHLARSAHSLLGQSLSPEEYEVIYVDDGSTDESPARLAALQASHSNVVVLTQPNSGWPGRPRNVGIDRARGVYVQFVDQDDRLGPQALERLWALSVQHFPDIVLGKMGGGMSYANLVFKRNVARGDHLSIPAIETLTAHKMFRRQFLLDHDIRFPEGYWRGEDLLFMARAYARVSTMAVLADYVCYYWDRHESGHHSLAAYDLAGHYDRLRQIVAALRDGTEPGILQDRLLRRLYRVEVLGPLGDVDASALLDDTVQQSFHRSRALARECFPEGVREGMPAVQKLKATLLERGELAQMIELNRRTTALEPRIERLVDLREDGTLLAHLRVGLGRAEAEPLTVVRRDGRWLLDPAFVGDVSPGAELEVTEPTGYAHAELRLFNPQSHVWWYPEGELTPELKVVDDDRFEVVAEGDLLLDPRVAAAGRPLEPGNYWVWVVYELLGVVRRRRLVMPTELAGVCGPWIVTSPRQLVRYDWSRDGRRLRLQVRDRHRWLEGNVRPADSQRFTDGTRLTIPIDIASRHVPGSHATRVELRADDVAGQVKGVLTVDDSERAGSVRLRRACELPDGRYHVSFGRKGVVVAQVRVRNRRLLHVRPATQAGSSVLADWLRDRASPGSLLGSVRRFVRGRT